MPRVAKVTYPVLLSGGGGETGNSFCMREVPPPVAMPARALKQMDAKAGFSNSPPLYTDVRWHPSECRRLLVFLWGGGAGGGSPPRVVLAAHRDPILPAKPGNTATNRRCSSSWVPSTDLPPLSIWQFKFNGSDEESRVGVLSEPQLPSASGLGPVRFTGNSQQCGFVALASPKKQTPCPPMGHAEEGR